MVIEHGASQSKVNSILNIVLPSSVRTKRNDSFLILTKLFRGLVGSPASGGG
jgi:hypothetical protein